MKEVTRERFAKVFKDMVQLENEIELERKNKINNINISELYRSIDIDRKGFCTLHDYY
jgi:hypothetical protein